MKQLSLDVQKVYNEQLEAKYDDAMRELDKVYTPVHIFVKSLSLILGRGVKVFTSGKETNT